MPVNHPPTVNGVPVPYGATLKELSQGLGEPGPTAWAAFAALGVTPGNDALRLLSDYTCSADWRYRRLAVESISNHELALEAADVLIQALTDVNLYVVITGCRAVAQHRLFQAHASLATLLSHPEPTVREAAVSALATLWQRGDYEAVKRLYLFDTSPSVCKEAAWALFSNASEATWRDLYALWRVSSAGRYRLWAIRLARQFGNAEDIQLLTCFQNDPDGHVRKAAASTVPASQSVASS